MPNWCENDLYVRGSKEELEKFKEAVRGTGHDGEEKLICEDKIIPYPENFRLLDVAAEEYRQKYPIGFKIPPKDGFNQGGREWCLENWGTKWGFVEVELVVESDDELQYTFRTAWSPPNPLIRKLGEMFPNLEFEFRYFEGGMGFNGILSIKEGQAVDDRTGEYFGSRGG